MQETDEEVRSGVGETGGSRKRKITSKEFFETAYFNCFRYLNVNTLREAQEMSIYEYRTRFKAYQDKMVDDAHDLHYHAWLVTRVMPAMKENNKYVFEKFEDIFDKDEIKSEMSGEKQREKDKVFNQLRERQRRMMEFENKRGKEETDE